MTRLIDRVQFFPPNEIEVFYYEIFEVGEQTIKSELLKFTTGLDYSDFLSSIQSELDADSPTPIPVKPDWSSFTAQIFQTEIYQIFRETTSNQKTWVVLENLSVSSAVSGNDLSSEGYQLLVIQWNLLVTGSSFPTPEQIAQLNAIATSTNMKFSFDENCLMVIV
ncbi:hypothetical protein H6G36_25680 [Anabaena minutissima FACHB-250]|nr:hypothetical protein [Anabaena minutissima FACHB-250]